MLDTATNIVESSNNSETISNKENTLSQNFFNGKRALLYIGLVLFLIIVISSINITLPGSKIDDWQFNSQRSISFDDGVIGFLQSIFRFGWSYYANFSFVDKVIFVISVFLLSCLPIGSQLVNYRFLNWIISKFKKTFTYTIHRKKILEFSILIVGILAWCCVASLLYFVEEYRLPLFASIIMVSLFSVIIFLLSPLSLLFYSIAALWNKLAKKGLHLRTWGLSSLSLFFNLGNFVVIYALFQFAAYILGFTSLNSAMSSTKSINNYGASGGISPGTGWSASPSFGALPMTGGADAGNIGFSVGGAKDVNNFRENIKNNYFPLLSDITYEGLFYDYYFDTTGEMTPCSDLFCPAYTYASSNDPISQQPEHYLSVGLNSNIKESDFQRKKLNVVIVMDISGSMGSSFDRYYYDQINTNEPSELETKTKMEVANESLVALLDHLNPEDRLGIVLFDDVSYLAKPVGVVADTDLEGIKRHILEITEQGGTNMEAGYSEGTSLLEEYVTDNKEEYENRIIFLTDAQPNTGQLDQEGLFGLSQANAEKGIYTTFIGVGVDFNTELIEAMTKVEGANYYAVHSSEEFVKRMGEGFEYMVTPLVFDLNLQFLSDDFEIEKVYGSPEADEATGQIMKVNTLFPSDSKDGEVKGGVILLKLKPKNSPTGTASLRASYKTRSGEVKQNKIDVRIGDTAGEFFGSTGIRKAILLTRYANLIKAWTADERQAVSNGFAVSPRITSESGIIIIDDIEPVLSQWERQSVPLKVSPEYGALLFNFRNYFTSESGALLDETLDKETQVLDTLIRKSGHSQTLLHSNLPMITPIQDELTIEQAKRIQ